MAALGGTAVPIHHTIVAGDDEHVLGGRGYLSRSTVGSFQAPPLPPPRSAGDRIVVKDPGVVRPVHAQLVGLTEDVRGKVVRETADDDARVQVLQSDCSSPTKRGYITL